jgi:hypothetical protein
MSGQRQTGFSSRLLTHGFTGTAEDLAGYVAMIFSVTPLTTEAFILGAARGLAAATCFYAILS